MAVASYPTVIKTAGISTAFVGEAFALVAGTTYQITDATKRVWDRSVTPTIKDGGVAIPAANITAYDWLFGTVTLASAPAGAVTGDGNYLPMTQKSGFRSHNLNLGGVVQDNTTYDNNSGSMRRKQTLNDVELTLGGFMDPWFFTFTDVAKNTASDIDASTDPVTFNMEAGHGLVINSWIRIEDEILRVTVVNINAITATRGAFDTVPAAHASGKDVFLMNASHYSRSAFMVEIRPAGSAADLFRGWYVVSGLQFSGAVPDLEQCSASLVLDGGLVPGSSFGHGAA